MSKLFVAGLASFFIRNLTTQQGLNNYLYKGTFMLRRFQFPLGLILSYATYSALLWETDHSIHAIRSLLANNDFIVFLQALLSKSGGSALAQTTTVAVALVNVEMVLHRLSRWFLLCMGITCSD